MFEKIKDVYYDVKYFYQRGKRGYSDRDLWSLDHYLAKVISGSLKNLAMTSHGCPEDFYDEKATHGHECDRWGEYLYSIADEFEKYSDEIDIPGFKDREHKFEDGKFITIPEITDEQLAEYRKLVEEKEKRIDKAFNDLRKYFSSLWD